MTINIYYPAKIDNGTSIPDVVDNVTPIDAEVLNRLKAVILAIEAELGVKPSGVYGTVRARLDALESIIAGGGMITFDGDLSGNSASQTVVGFKNRPLSNTSPSVGQSYIWDGSLWTPGTVSSFTPGGDLSGNSYSQNVIKIQNHAVNPAAPANGDVLTWDQADGYWHPAHFNGAQNFFPFGPTAYITAPPTITGGTWTQFNPIGSPAGWVAATIQDHPVGYGVQVTANGAGSHECFAGIFQARGTNVRWTGQFDAPIFDSFGAGGPSPFVAMSIYDSGASKSVNFGIAENGSNPLLIVVHQNYSSFATISVASGVMYHSSFPIWLRIADDGTNYIFYYSFDGVTFANIYQESKTAYLSAGGDYVGVGVQVTDASNPTSGVTHASLWLGSWDVVNGGVVPFNPSQLSGLLLWNKSNVGVTQAGTVTEWDDQSGNNFIMTPPSTAPAYVSSDPQYNNLPSLKTTDNASAMVTTTSLEYGPYTYFLVCKPVTGGYLATHNDGFEYFFGTTNDTSYTGVRGGSDSSAWNIAYPNWSVYHTPKVITKRFDGTYAGDIVRVNGTVQLKQVVNMGDPGTDPITQPFSISGNTAAGFGAQGTFAEVIVYNRVLSDMEVGQVEQYCYDRYNFYNNKSFWLRADQGITKDGSNLVSDWADISTGNAEVSLSQADGTLQPTWNASGINGLPDISLSGTTFLMGTSALLGEAGITMFGIFKTVGTNTMFIFGQQYNSYQYAVFISSGPTGTLNFFAHQAQNLSTTATYNDGNPHYFIVTYDAQATGLMNIYVDDTTAPVATGTATVFQRIFNDNGDVNSVGTSHGTGAGDHDRAFVGEIAEIGTYDYAISDADLATLGAYLKNRAGI